MNSLKLYLAAWVELRENKGNVHYRLHLRGCTVAPGRKLILKLDGDNKPSTGKGSTLY